MTDFSTAEWRERRGATGFTAKSQYVEKGRTCIFAADIFSLCCLNSLQREEQMVLWFGSAFCFGDPSAIRCVTFDPSAKPTDAKVNTNFHIHPTYVLARSSPGK